MASYRVFQLHLSASDRHGAYWEDFGSVEMDLASDAPAVVGEQFGAGEYLVLDEQFTILDFPVT